MMKPAGQRDTAGRGLGVPGVTGGAAVTAEHAVVPWNGPNRRAAQQGLRELICRLFHYTVHVGNYRMAGSLGRRRQHVKSDNE